MQMSTDTFLKQKLGRYEIRERLGVGGMARVFLGWDTTLDRQVAIKVLHDHLVEDSTFRERFEREAKLVATLNHPNIVPIYDYDSINMDTGSICYMVMPYFSGNTLTDLIAVYKTHFQSVPQVRVLDIMLELCAALGYAHKRGMIHRDIKPSNVMFDEHDRSILTDFGIARLKEGTNLTQDGATVGTPAYISPEQAAGLPVDARTDLYSLGIILYEMLAGELPYSGDSMISLILQHINAPVPTLPAINHQFQAIIDQSLAKNPDDRFQSADEFAAALKLAFNQPISGLSPNETLNLTPDFIPTSQFATRATPKQSSVSVQATLIPLTLAALAAIIIIGILITNRVLSSATKQSPATPTAIASMTDEEGVAFRSTFDAKDPSLARWQQNNEGDVQRQMTASGFYHIVNHISGTAATALFDPASQYKQATITMQAELNNTSARTSGYGIIFRYLDESNYSVFAIDGVSRYSLWQLQNGQWNELRGLREKWTEDVSIQPQGQPNQLSLTFSNDEIIGSVNNHQLVDLQIKPKISTTGAVGIYLATTSNGSASITVDSYEVGNQAPSMTGESP